MSDQRAETIRAYMAALDAADYETIVASFIPEGVVTSPFLGAMPAAEFFAQLSRASSRNVITPLDIFVSAEDPTSAAAYFEYDWTMADGSTTVFNVVDHFRFTEAGDRFVSMTIIYDTHPVRAEHGDKYQTLADARD